MKMKIKISTRFSGKMSTPRPGERWRFVPCVNGTHFSYPDIPGYFDLFVIEANEEKAYYELLSAWASCGCMVKAEHQVADR